MKKFPITLGVDDAHFNLHSNNKKTFLIGVVCQGTRMIGVYKKEITIDGDDSTEALTELIEITKKHVQYVLTDTITFAGFNIYDMKEVYEKTKKPIIAVSEQKVDLDSVKRAIEKRFPKKVKDNKLKKIINAGNLFEIEIKTAGGLSKAYYHCKGIDHSTIKKLFEKICIDSKLPEPIRMAHIIGKII
ncbi:MAG: DUF99 family protein [Promethearchaeia archaeon]